MARLQELESKLGYRFKTRSLLDLALTHCSADSDHNERLEFLGDAVLGAVIAELLFAQTPLLSDGELTVRRAALVNGERLADLARQLGLGKYLNLGRGEEKTGGRDRDSILENALEAIIGAIFLDGGWGAAHDAIASWWGGLLTEPVVQVVKEAKTRLQELLQARKMALPEYVISKSGPAHSPIFKAECSVAGVVDKFIGEGKTRRQAEQSAAANMQEWLEKNDK